MDLDLLDSTNVPGVMPPRQARSRKVVSDLVEATLRLLRDRGFEAVSIAEICAEAGVTTGAFYKRFPSKELFVEFLQRAVVEEMRRGIDATLTVERWGHLTLRGFLGKTVRGTVGWFRQYEGFVRASLRLAGAHPDSWSPMRETGARYAAAVEPIVMHVLRRPDSAQVRAATRFAVQTMLGTLHSMVLIDPGPYRLHDERTVGMLTEAMATLIEAAPRDPVAGRARHAAGGVPARPAARTPSRPPAPARTTRRRKS